MTSYQHDEFIVAPVKGRKQQNNSSAVWKYAALVSVMCATGLLAYSSYGFTSGSSSKKIMMAKEGQIKYAELEDEDVITLWKAFKAKYTKSVRQPACILRDVSFFKYFNKRLKQIFLSTVRV